MAFLEALTDIEKDPVLKKAYSAFAENSYLESLSSFAESGTPESDYCQAFQYLNGRGSKKDPKKAFSLFVKSMEAGYLPAISEVAQCYGYGIGVKVDDGKAFELFARAAEEGDPYGMSMLSMMYRNGDGVKRNNKKAEEWADRCEESGDLEDLEEAGLDYLSSGNTILGRMYLMRSAVMGSPISAKALACIFSFGEGVSQDEDEASDWEDTAETNGWGEVTLGDIGDHADWFKKYLNLDDLAEDDE